MDRQTVAVYERSARAYGRRRSAVFAERAEAFAAALPVGALRLDLGCGPGLYVEHLGAPVVAADAAPAMVAEARRRAPLVSAVCADLAWLPFRRGVVGGVWACRAHQHIAAEAMPAALAELHRVIPVGGRLELTVFEGDGAMTTGPTDDFPGRLFTLWGADALSDLLGGAGFTVDRCGSVADAEHTLAVTATRARTLADRVGPGMALLLCGLNPSIYSADAGVGFARPGNRFWRAMIAAGLTTVARDADHLLFERHIGLTDLVKRATVAAAELTTEEYRAGIGRVERLCRWLRPAAVGFIGLAGWRAVVDRRAVAGWQPEPLGEVPVYLMPSTSGLNAHSTVATLAEHLRAAAQAATGDP